MKQPSSPRNNRPVAAKQEEHVHIYGEDLELYLSGRLNGHREAEVSAHLDNCPTCCNELVQTREFLNQLARLNESLNGEIPERRKIDRFASDDPAVIKLIYPAVSDSFSARILDMSVDGYRIETPRLIEPGTTVEIILERAIAIAEVRHCNRVGDAYHAGVVVQDAFAKLPSRR
jgi:hypothetical protein